LSGTPQAQGPLIRAGLGTSAPPTPRHPPRPAGRAAALRSPPQAAPSMHPARHRHVEHRNAQGARGGTRAARERRSGNEVVAIRRAKTLQPALIVSGQQVGKPHVHDVVVHDDVALALVVQVEVARAVDRDQDGEE